MANADFSKQEKAPGGFTAGSYQAKTAKAEKPLTPMQKKLAGLEKALPTGLKNQAVASLILVLFMVISLFGISGVKLRSQYKKTAASFAAGVDADMESGGQYSMQIQLDRRSGAAGSLITAASGIEGVDSEILAQAQAAWDALYQAMQEQAGPAALYDADVALEAAINLLHADVQANTAAANKVGAEQTAFSQFSSTGTTMRHLSYNETVQAYNDMISSFPASVIGKLWGCGKVERFA